jgi:hypothetical protein
MRRQALLPISAVLMLAAAGAGAQSAGGPPASPGAALLPACFALGVAELRGDDSGFRKLKQGEIVQQLQRRVLSAAQDPAVQAMLACMLRRTAG